MILSPPSTQTANMLLDYYNLNIANSRERAEIFIEGTSPDVRDGFKRGEFRTIIITQRLLEGFDNVKVAFVAITSKVVSPVRFNQFVGRAVRIDRDMLLEATLITHTRFAQEDNLIRLRGGDWDVGDDES